MQFAQTTTGEQHYSEGVNATVALYEGTWFITKHRCPIVHKGHCLMCIDVSKVHSTTIVWQKCTINTHLRCTQSRLYEPLILFLLFSSSAGKASCATKGKQLTIESRVVRPESARLPQIRLLSLSDLNLERKRSHYGSRENWADRDAWCS